MNIDIITKLLQSKVVEDCLIAGALMKDFTFMDLCKVGAKETTWGENILELRIENKNPISTTAYQINWNIYMYIGWGIIFFINGRSRLPRSWEIIEL